MMQSTLDQFVIERKLGKGISGVVKLATDSDTGNQYAVKILVGRSAAAIARFRQMAANEVQSLQQITHPNIVKLIGTNDTGMYTRKQGRGNYTCQYIVMELCPNGELFDVLYETGRFPEKVSRGLFHQLISGVSACHSAGIVHRDLKPENVLFDARFNLKIADFGFSVVSSGRDGSGMLHTYRGTEGYMAPEIIARRPYSGISVDLFAAGVILFIMMSQTPPFSRATPIDPYYGKLASGDNRFWEIHSRNKPADFYSKDFQSLIQSMLALDPAQRLSIAEIQSHPWFNGPIATLDEIYDELSVRHSRVVEAAALAQAQREARVRAIASGGQVNFRARNFKSNPNLMEMSSSLTSSSEMTSSLPGAQLVRKAGTYNQNSWKYSQILSPLETEELFEFIQLFLEGKNSKPDVSSDSYKLTSRLTTDGEELVITVKILKGENLNCVNIDKKSGSHFDMIELLHELTASLEEHTERELNES